MQRRIVGLAVDPADNLPLGLSGPFTFIREARVGADFLLSLFPVSVACCFFFVLIKHCQQIVLW